MWGAKVRKMGDRGGQVFAGRAWGFDGVWPRRRIRRSGCERTEGRRGASCVFAINAVQSGGLGRLLPGFSDYKMPSFWLCGVKTARGMVRIHPNGIEVRGSKFLARQRNGFDRLRRNGVASPGVQKTHRLKITVTPFAYPNVTHLCNALRISNLYSK